MNKKYIYLYVSDQTLVNKGGEIYRQNTESYLAIKFELSQQWMDMDMILVLFHTTVKTLSPFILNKETLSLEIPISILKETAYKIGMIGITGNQVVTTNQIMIVQTPSEPTPTQTPAEERYWYVVLLDKINTNVSATLVSATTALEKSVQELIETARQYANAASESAQTAQQLSENLETAISNQEKESIKALTDQQGQSISEMEKYFANKQKITSIIENEGILTLSVEEENDDL